MAEHIIEADPNPETRLNRLRAEVDEQLISALCLSDLVQWIENARYFVDTMKWKIERMPALQDWAKDEEFAWNTAEWQKAESEGLEYLHMEIGARMRAARTAVAQVKQ